MKGSVGKRKYELEAIEYVKLYEKRIGHKCWKPHKKIGCDLLSSGGYYIEVKSWNKKSLPNSIQVYESIFKHLSKKKKGKSTYYIYIVYDFKNPKLIRIPPSKQNWYETKIRLLKKSSYKNIPPVKLSQYKHDVKTSKSK